MNMTLDDIMFVRAVFLKMNRLCVLYPCRDTNEYCDTGIVLAPMTKDAQPLTE
jgi:hypothetical protein